MNEFSTAHHTNWVSARNHKLVGHAFWVVKKVLYHSNRDNFVLGEWKCSTISLPKLTYTDTCNCFTKRALVNQQNILVAAKGTKHLALFKFINEFTNDYLCQYFIEIHDCLMLLVNHIGQTDKKATKMQNLSLNQEAIGHPNFCSRHIKNSRCCFE